MIAGGNVTSQAVNTPSIIVGDGSSSIKLLDANTARIGFTVQNVGSTAALIRIGGEASGSVFNFSVKGGTADNDGLGGSLFFTSGVIPNGKITMFGASTAKVVCLEVAP